MSGGADSAAVVGAGVVGLCTALALAREGFAVTVIDRGGPGEGCSFGNAGGVATGEVIPLATPGLLARVPGWLLDPLGPLALDWRSLPALAPWLLRFLAATRRRAFERNVDGCAALCRPSLEDHYALAREAGIEALYVDTDALFVYERAGERERDAFKWDLRGRHGVVFHELGAAELAALEPGLSPGVACGVRVEDWPYVRDPHRVVTGLAQCFLARGGCIERGEVARVRMEGRRARALELAGGGELAVERLVVAAGVWSRRLAAEVGDRVPLVAERGYHATLPAPGVQVRHMILYPAQGFVITPMAMGLRLAGTVELASVERPPREARARVLIAKARRLLPGLDDAGARLWMGHRPALPDCLPVIGRSPRADNVCYAFGHGHLGLTWAPTTGRLIADLLCGRRPAIDLRPYRVERF